MIEGVRLSTDDILPLRKSLETLLETGQRKLAGFLRIVENDHDRVVGVEIQAHADAVDATVLDPLERILDEIGGQQLVVLVEASDRA